MSATLVSAPSPDALVEITLRLIHSSSDEGKVPRSFATMTVDGDAPPLLGRAELRP